MAFHSSKNCPLYNGFSFIQRLSAVLWLFIHPKTVCCTMAFHSSKNCPLYNGFSFIQRLSTVQLFLIHQKLSTLQWVSFTQNQVYPHFSLSSSLSPQWFTLRLIPSIHLSLCLPSFVLPKLLILWFSTASLLPVSLFTRRNHRNGFSSVTSYIIALIVSFQPSSFLYFVTDLLQHSISVANAVFSVTYIYSTSNTEHCPQGTRHSD